MALGLLVVGSIGLALLNRQTQLTAKLHVRASISSMMKVLTHSSITTINQLLSAVDASGQPYFVVDEVAKSLKINRPLPPYVDSIYDEASKTFTFNHCDMRAVDFRQEKYSLDSALDDLEGCNNTIDTSIRIDDIDASTVTVLAQSTTDRDGFEGMRYRIGARLIRQRCDLLDPAEPTKLNPNYIFEDMTYQCHGKFIRVKLDRFRDSAVYNAATDTVKFEYWIYHEENKDHNCSSYRWDQFYNAYPGYVGNVDAWPNVGYSGPDQHVKGNPAFVRGKWIWNGGWNRKREVTIHNATKGGMCTVSIVVKSGQPEGKRNGGCFAQGTRMRLVDGREVPVEELRMGMRLWNPVTQTHVIVHQLVAGPEKETMYRIHSEGKALLVTSEHPFLTREGLKAAKHLSPSDELWCESQGYCGIQAIDQVAPENDTKVYNVMVSYGDEYLDNHYIVADGIATGDLYMQQWLHQRTSPTPKHPLLTRWHEEL